MLGIIARQTAHKVAEVLRGERNIDVLTQLHLDLGAGERSDVERIGRGILHRFQQEIGSAGQHVGEASFLHSATGPEQSHADHRRSGGVAWGCVRIHHILGGMATCGKTTITVLRIDHPVVGAVFRR